MREPAGGQAGGRHWQDCLGGGTLESGKEGGRPKKKGQSLDPHLLWPVRERCVSLPTQAASSLRIIDAEKQKQKTSKQTKPQSKQNHKCVCGAPVMCFCPILIIGDNGPLFPGEPSPWPGRFPLQSLTAAASNFLDLFSPPRSPPLSRPGLLITEEVKPLWGPLGFSVVPLPHLVSPCPSCHHGSWPASFLLSTSSSPALDPSLPAALWTSSIEHSLSLPHLQLLLSSFHSPLTLGKKNSLFPVSFSSY